MWKRTAFSIAILVFCCHLSVQGSSGTAEGSYLILVRHRMLVARFNADGRLPSTWGEFLDDSLRQAGRDLLGHELEELYVLYPEDDRPRNKSAEILVISAYPCRLPSGNVGRYAIIDYGDGIVGPSWLMQRELDSSFGRPRIPRPVKLDGTPAPELGYTAENPRPIVAAARIPEQWRKLPPTPLDRMHQTDRQSYRDLMEGARLAYPEPYTMVWSNETITLVWPLGTRHGIQGSTDADATPPSPPPPDTGSRRTWVVGLTTAIAVFLAAVAFRHRRR